MATTFEMTVTQALVELKTLNDRIEKAIAGATFIIAICPSTEPRSKDDYEKDITASFQKVNDLIIRRDAIKAALITSNATTNVVVGGQEMTVAVAIDRKQHANEMRKLLLKEMSRQTKNAVNNYRTMKANVESNARTMLKNMGVSQSGIISVMDGSADTNNASMTAYKAYIESNPIELIDPLDMTAKMEALEKELADFDAEVDVALSVKNATTVIKGEY